MARNLILNVMPVVSLAYNECLFFVSLEPSLIVVMNGRAYENLAFEKSISGCCSINLVKKKYRRTVVRTK